MTRTGVPFADEKEDQTMRKYLVTAQTIKTMLVAFVFALAAVNSVPAAAKDKSLSNTELKRLIANAQSKADHERIAQHFDAEAVKYDADAKDNAELSSFYKKNPDPALSKHQGSSHAFEHCDALSKSLRQAAQDARDLAAAHRDMGREANH